MAFNPRTEIHGDIAPKVAETSSLVADDISQYVYKSWDELFDMSRKEVEAFQLRSARRRFDELLPRVAALQNQADMKRVTHVDTLNDLVPLLFNHTVYKAYPISLLENSRFDLLTQWLQGITTVDLSRVDVSQCTGIDDWIDTLEQITPLRIFHTSGTTGKLSFIPRTTLEHSFWNQAYLKAFGEGFGDEPSTPLGGPNGERFPVVYPGFRHGHYSVQRIIHNLTQAVAPSPGECYTLSDGTLSADVISLSGRIRIAQGKGELSRMKLSDGQRVALKRHFDDQARLPQELAKFFSNLTDKLHGKRILLFSQTSYLVQASREGLTRGLAKVFSPDSIGMTGGGGKGMVLPPDWRELISNFTGMPRLKMLYAMTEMTSNFPYCPHKHFHVPPFIVPFLLEPESGAVLPRQDKQTGRLAFLDLLAQTFWGGFISGDKVTIEWDSTCPCGRKGAFFHDSVERYSAKVTDDDRITCAETINNTDEALNKLLAG